MPARRAPALIPAPIINPDDWPCEAADLSSEVAPTHVASRRLTPLCRLDLWSSGMSDLSAPFVLPLRPWRSRLATRLAQAVTRPAEDQALRRSREKLAEYDDRLLLDLGITRTQASGRPTQPSWAKPEWWRM